MTPKILLGTLGVLIVILIGFFLALKPSSVALTKDQAIDAVIAQHPELAAYKTTSLPPSAIETKPQVDGWSIAFVQRGSGIPGILQAHCYHVGTDSAIVATGKYVRMDNVEADTIVVEDCTPNNIAMPEAKCYVGGCSAQLCTGEPDAVSNCEYNPRYACYKTAECERQVNGQCGWTSTPELSMCLSQK
jgi:hypothetical protein